MNKKVLIRVLGFMLFFIAFACCSYIQNVNKFPSEKQKKKVIKLIKYIRKHCPNAKTIIRHYDVNGKQCPLLYVKDEAKWKAFKREIDVW